MSSPKKGNMNNQRIVCAAIRTGDGRIVCGARHYDSVMHSVFRSFLLREISKEEQGFIDQNGNFLTRKQAYKVAVKAKQIIKNTANFSKELYSENLY